MIKALKRLSKISLSHYIKLIFRSALFISAAVIYIINRINKTGMPFGDSEHKSLVLGVIWLVFVIEMIFRFFPSKIESMGCQKQFARNFKNTNASKEKPKLQSAKSTFAVAAFWIGLNAIIGLLYYIHIIDEGILFLISLAFSVCDMICILFFCPFQTWFMKNKCCTSCRIYNWDYAMMFTPLVFIKSFYTWSILLCAVMLLVRWEITVFKYPERFSEETNACLSCTGCQERLCSHKKQLRGFLLRNKSRLQLKGNEILGKVNNIQKKLRKNG